MSACAAWLLAAQKSVSMFMKNDSSPEHVIMSCTLQAPALNECYAAKPLSPLLNGTWPFSKHTAVHMCHVHHVATIPQEHDRTVKQNESVSQVQIMPTQSTARHAHLLIDTCVKLPQTQKECTPSHSPTGQLVQVLP